MGDGATVSSEAKDKKWTMLVYMAGDNNLTEEMVWGLQEMKKKLETEPEINKDVGVIVQYDAAGLNPSLLYLNKDDAKTKDGAKTGADGNLHKKVEKEISTTAAIARASAKIEPTAGQKAIANLYEFREDINPLIEVLAKDAPMEKHRAEWLLASLMMLSPDGRARVLKNEPTKPGSEGPGPLDRLMVRAITERPEPTPEEVTRGKEIARRLGGRIERTLEDVKARQKTNADKVQLLAELIARFTNSASRGIRELSSPLMLQDFIERQLGTLETQTLVAEHHVVILSGHGGGATGDFLPDEDPQSALTIPQLGRILREAKKTYDANNKGQRSDIILGLDSCLMSMAEVAYEVQDSATYLVGSEGFVPNTGWPYHRVVEALADGSSAVAAAEKMVENYAAFYQDYEMGGVSTHLAAIDVSQIGSLAQAVGLLARALREQLALLDEDAEFGEIDRSERVPQQEQSRKIRDAMILAHWYAQSFKWGRYVDLHDFCDQLLRFLPDNEEQIRNCCDLVKHLTKKAVKRSYYTGPDFQHAHGLSVYFPWSVEDFTTEYLNLKFARETGWYDLVVEYLRRTRRLRRGQRQFHEPKEAVPWKFGSDVGDKLLLNSGELTGLARADVGLLSRVDFSAQSRADVGLLSRADVGLLVRADVGLLSRADTGLLSRVAGGKLAGSFQNTPDGFFRQQITGNGEIFIAKNQEELDKKK